jgi:hypothetical protein
MRIARISGLLAVMTLMVGVNSARAAFILYTDQTLWTNAVAALGLGVTVEDFSDATLVTGLTTANGSISGGTFNASANTQFNNAGNPNLSITGGTQALGGIWDLSPGGGGDGLVFMINGTAAVPSGTQAYVQLPPFNGFIGFISNDATLITSLRLDSPGTGFEAFSVDNLQFASGQVVAPEPATLALLGMGLAATIARGRRRR